TRDGGVTWNGAHSGQAQSAPLAIDPQNANVVFASGVILTDSGQRHTGIYKSTDGTTSWSASWDAGNTYSNWITTLTVDPQNSNIIYATTQAFDECTMETLHKSMDGGISWSDLVFKDLGVPATCILDFVIDPQRPSNLYAAFEYGGVFKSDDGGASWVSANSGLPPAWCCVGPSFSAVALAIDPRDPRTLYAVSRRWLIT